MHYQDNLTNLLNIWSDVLTCRGGGAVQESGVPGADQPNQCSGAQPHSSDPEGNGSRCVRHSYRPGGSAQGTSLFEIWSVLLILLWCI